jgi:hypothetical protein
VRRAMARARGSCANRAVTANSSAVLSTRLLAAGARAGRGGRRTVERGRAADETGAEGAGDAAGMGAVMGASVCAPAHAEMATRTAAKHGLIGRARGSGNAKDSPGDKVPALSPATAGHSSVTESSVSKKATATDEQGLRATRNPKRTSA